MDEQLHESRLEGLSLDELPGDIFALLLDKLGTPKPRSDASESTPTDPHLHALYCSSSRTRDAMRPCIGRIEVDLADGMRPAETSSQSLLRGFPRLAELRQLRVFVKTNKVGAVSLFFTKASSRLANVVELDIKRETSMVSLSLIMHSVERSVTIIVQLLHMCSF